jgi:DNA-binding MarR family transcriptional regulator
VRASPDPPGRSTVAGTGVRRIVRLSLTDAGREALARAEAAYLSRLQPLLAEVPDPDQLIGGLLAVGAALETRPAMAVRR